MSNGHMPLCLVFLLLAKCFVEQDLINLPVYSVWAHLLSSTFWIMLVFISRVPVSAWLICFLAMLPLVTAQEMPFPDIPFKLLAQFAKENFEPKISLANVLLVLFTITDNPDLIALHARQRNPTCNGERHAASTLWIKRLAYGLCERFGENHIHLLKGLPKPTSKDKTSVDKTPVTVPEDNLPTPISEGIPKPKAPVVPPPMIVSDEVLCHIGSKLEALAKLLNLYPYDEEGVFRGKFMDVSYKSIQGVQFICPNSYICETASCNP